jgi:hypothetical protein
MKYLKHSLATSIYYHCNICNIVDLLSQHLDETIEIESLKRSKHLKHRMSPTATGYMAWNYGSQRVRVMGTSRATAGNLLLVVRCTP